MSRQEFYRMARSVTLLFSTAMLLTGCFGMKCVKVVDARGGPVEGATLRFSATKKPNETRYGGFVTTVFPYYEVLVGKTDASGEICFSEHKEEDALYSYRDHREWRFRMDDTWARFHLFEKIPNVVVLEAIPPAEDDEYLRKQLRRGP